MGDNGEKKAVEGDGGKDIEKFKSGDGKFKSAGNLIGDEEGAKAEKNGVVNALTHLPFID